MIPTLFTGGVLIAPGAALISTGYVAGNTLGAQHFNWYLYHLTAELNNLLAGVGISQSTGDDQQVMKAVGLAQVSISATGTTTATAFAGDTWVKYNNSGGAATYDISAGAARAGVRLIIEEIHANGVTIQTGASQTAILGIGSIHILWNGTRWVKIGGSTFSVVLGSGTGATFKTPFSTVYKCMVKGGGGGGGGCAGAPTYSAGASGGGEGGEAIGWLNEVAGATFTYTVGALGAGGTSGANDGTAGSNSTLTDGVTTLTGGGGGSGGAFSAGTFLHSPGAGGVASGGAYNIPGSPGTIGSEVPIAAPAFGGSGSGGGRGGGPGKWQATGGGANGTAATGFGAGGGGGATNGSANAAGGNGSPGVIVIEF